MDVKSQHARHFKSDKKPADFACLHFQNLKLQHAPRARTVSCVFCNTQRVLSTCQWANSTWGMCSVCCVLVHGSRGQAFGFKGSVSGSGPGCRTFVLETVTVWNARSRLSRSMADLLQAVTAWRGFMTSLLVPPGETCKGERFINNA